MRRCVTGSAEHSAPRDAYQERGLRRIASGPKCCHATVDHASRADNGFCPFTAPENVSQNRMVPSDVQRPPAERGGERAQDPGGDVDGTCPIGAWHYRRGAGLGCPRVSGTKWSCAGILTFGSDAASITASGAISSLSERR